MRSVPSGWVLPSKEGSMAGEEPRGNVLILIVHAVLDVLLRQFQPQGKARPAPEQSMTLYPLSPFFNAFQLRNTTHQMFNFSDSSKQ